MGEISKDELLKKIDRSGRDILKILASDEIKLIGHQNNHDYNDYFNKLFNNVNAIMSDVKTHERSYEEIEDYYCYIAERWLDLWRIEDTVCNVIKLIHRSNDDMNKDDRWRGKDEI
jgi:hypothetical protein